MNVPNLPHSKRQYSNLLQGAQDQMVSNFLQCLCYSGLTAARPAGWSWWDTSHLPAWGQTQKCFSRTDNVWIGDKCKCFRDMWRTALHTGTVLLMSGSKRTWTFVAVLKCSSCGDTARSGTPGWEQESSSPGHLEAGEKEETTGNRGSGHAASSCCAARSGFPFFRTVPSFLQQWQLTEGPYTKPTLGWG